MSDQNYYHRGDLAKRLADDLLGINTVSTAASGLFLAAPRRVGKSTFIKIDLVPELQKRSVETIYVDLWSDKTRDPAELLHNAIKEKFSEHEGLLAKAGRRLKKINMGAHGYSLGIDFDKLGKEGGPTIADALDELHRKLDKPIALIIDEAQGALATEAGRQMMFAVKAARDRLNVGQNSPNLLLICTGSDRSKLASLLTRKDQPFFGSSLSPFPFLDEGYTNQVSGILNKDRLPEKRFDPEVIWKAFGIVSHRPEELLQSLKDAMTSTEDVNIAVIRIAEDRARARLQETATQFEMLTPPQKAVLIRMIELGEQFAPFDKDALGFYGSYTKSKDFTAATVQSALESLTNKNIVWSSGRGVYAIEDAGVWTKWFEERGENAKASEKKASAPHRK